MVAKDRSTTSDRVGAVNTRNYRKRNPEKCESRSDLTKNKEEDLSNSNENHLAAKKVSMAEKSAKTKLAAVKGGGSEEKKVVEQYVQAREEEDDTAVDHDPYVGSNDVNSLASSDNGERASLPNVNIAIRNVIERRVATRVEEPFQQSVNEQGLPMDIIAEDIMFSPSQHVPETIHNGWAFPEHGKLCEEGANLESLFEVLFEWGGHLYLSNTDTHDNYTKHISNCPWFLVVTSYDSFLSGKHSQGKPNEGPNLRATLTKEGKPREPKRTNNDSMLQICKSILEDVVQNVGLFITCDSDTPPRMSKNDKKSFPDWTRDVNFIQDWKSNCKSLILAMERTLRNDPDGQWFRKHIWGDLKPNLEQLCCSGDAKTAYQTWNNKYNRLIQKAYAGVACNWEWKMRSTYYNKTKRGDGTAVWVQEFFFHSQYMREFRITHEAQLQSMHPSYVRTLERAKEDYKTLLAMNVWPADSEERKETFEEKYPGVDITDKNDNFVWDDMAKSFELARTNGMSQTQHVVNNEGFKLARTEGMSQGQRQVDKMNIFRFYGRGGWRNFFFLEVPSRSVRPGSLLRWRRDVRNQPNEANGWSEDEMRANTVDLASDLSKLQLRSASEVEKENDVASDEDTNES